MSGFVKIDGMDIAIDGEKNLLSLIRKAGIELPTFCYHSSLSVYGACRLCVVEINGKVDASCSMPPKDGMRVRTNTGSLRELRKMTLELLLANHDRECTSCERSDSCKLQDLSNKLGINKLRFRRTKEIKPLDTISETLIRNPNKCVLCGDCVRYCDEIQGVGAIDFAYRGEEAMVTPAYHKSIADVNCINCGQCAAICPTGALIIKGEKDVVWQGLEDDNVLMVAQVAPAVRVAMSEMFGGEAGEQTMGKITTGLRLLGFDYIFDTVFGADLTVVEEAEEFQKRLANGKKMPLFTSCCPAWVKYAEQFHPAILPHLSSCMSPQSMLGSVVKESYKNSGKEVRVVSIMPCSAKKFEKNRRQLTTADGRPVVDHVVTSRELAMMFKELGIQFNELQAGGMDQPMGMGSGSGTIFGTAGGVSEAVARYLANQARKAEPQVAITAVTPQIKEGAIIKGLTIGDRTIKICAVQGLQNAKKIARQVEKGLSDYDLIEVMACPGGCVGGAGQPIALENRKKTKRKQGLERIDSGQMLKSSDDNPFVRDLYTRLFDGCPGGERAHQLLHTSYISRQTIETGRWKRKKKSEV